MMKRLFILTVFFSISVSCNRDQDETKPNGEIPKALNDKSSSTDLVSNRAYDNLVESLYSELLNKDVDLKKLEDMIDAIRESKRDSISSFEMYNHKSELYFESVEKYISSIEDSLLRDKMRKLISENSEEYKLSITKHSELLKLVESKNISISDLHIILKIVKTLPLIEKYQKDNLPSTKSIEGYINEQNQAINLADSLSKK